MKKMENKQIKHKNQKKGLHNEKGAITLFVLTSLLLFIATITAVYTFMRGYYYLCFMVNNLEFWKEINTTT